ncbi:hypothetical protein [Succinimonas sp.]|uniref:hypothetical protein n=1 Tax=Succinimonas sp. TaxID=1936151 RepID=UPI00386E30ED
MRPQSRPSGLVRTDNHELRFTSFANRIPEEFNCPREGSEILRYTLKNLRRDAGDPEKAAAMYEEMEDIFRIGGRERSFREPDLFTRNNRVEWKTNI